MPIATEHIRRILIVNMFGIGDVLFTTPLIAQIKAHLPGVYIGYVANRRVAPLLSNNPKIDKVFIYERDEYHALSKRSKIRFLQRVLADMKIVKAENFDLVIDLSLNGNTSFLMWLIGVKTRLGFNYKNRSPLLTHKVFLEGYERQHTADYYLSLLSELGMPVQRSKLEIYVTDEETRWAQQVLAKYNLTKTSCIVGVVPGGGASWGQEAKFKRWPAENYAKLADKIVEKFNAAIILMGDQQEAELCSKVAKAMKHKAIELAGRTTVGQFAAITRECRVMMLNDGGPLHVAVAAGAKTVSVFGPVDEHVYGPYPFSGQTVITKDIACRPCYRRFRRASCEHVSCINSITVEEVLERIKGVLHADPS